jgi:hypothetical protein
MGQIRNLPPPDPEPGITLADLAPPLEGHILEGKLMRQTIRPASLAASVWIYIVLINLCSLIAGVGIGVLLHA